MKVNVKWLILQTAGFLTIFGLALFIPAGNITWPAGWIFLGLFFGFALCLYSWLYRHNPGLLRERMRLGTSDQQAWDKALFPLLQAYLLVWLIFMSLDAARFHWSPVPIWLQGGGVLILLCSFYLFFLTFRENSYLSPVVRIQDERGQRVISTGPYHYVRHPMYSAIMIFIVGTALLLGSAAGVPVGLLGMFILARRAVLEETILSKELSGYAAYKEKVRYRLIPLIW